MLFKLPAPGKIEDFTKRLALDVSRRYPAAIANDPDQTVSQRRINTILEGSFSSVYRFNLENRLGVFRRTILRDCFRWTLKEMGYDEKFIDMATRMLMASLTRETTSTFEQADKPQALD